MKIKTRIVLIFLPIVISSILSVAVMAIFPARSAIMTNAETFFSFKSDILKKEVIKQYELLVDGDVISDPILVESTKNGIADFAKGRLIEYKQSSDGTFSDTDWLVFALDDDGNVTFHSADDHFDLTKEERITLMDLVEKSLLADEEGNFSDEIPFSILELDKEKRVLQGFYFASFNQSYFLTVRESAYFHVINLIFIISSVILIVFIVISIIMILILASYLTRPILHIKKSMEEVIQSGDLSRKVNIEFNDEVGQLAHTFNIMTGELDKAYSEMKNYAYQAVLSRNNEAKIRNIFQKYVPQQLIDKFFENPESMLVGDNRTVCVLFSDIRSFTTISESLKPDELVESLNDYFTVMVDIVFNHNGIVDKYIGDAIMAFFGAPIAHADDSYQSVVTALEMSRLVKIFNQKQIEKGRPEFKIGVGVNFGEVTVGNIGTEKKMDYTVIGDTVNLASRLEGLTKEYHQEVIISEFLYNEVKDQIPCRMLDVVAVKGKTKGVRIFSPSDKLLKDEVEAWIAHNQAMQDYLDQNFKRAIENFSIVLNLLPEDFPATMMKERCLELIGKELPNDWDGVRIMKTK